MNEVYTKHLKPAEGVKFVEYDEFGIPKDDEIQQFICKEDLGPGAEFIAAPPEQLLKLIRPTGEFLDIDIEKKDMNAEGK
jgi:hypothetical protein